MALLDEAITELLWALWILLQVSWGSLVWCVTEYFDFQIEFIKTLCAVESGLSPLCSRLFLIVYVFFVNIWWVILLCLLCNAHGNRAIRLAAKVSALPSTLRYIWQICTEGASRLWTIRIGWNPFPDLWSTCVWTLQFIQTFPFQLLVQTIATFRDLAFEEQQAEVD